jgi:K+-sensing histidine kinase KdpD
MPSLVSAPTASICWGLINTVLDIAKIESGQFTLNMGEYAIKSVVETVRASTESLAQNTKLTLMTSVDKALPVGLRDEQRLTKCCWTSLATPSPTPAR